MVSYDTYNYFNSIYIHIDKSNAGSIPALPATATYKKIIISGSSPLQFMK